MHSSRFAGRVRTAAIVSSLAIVAATTACTTDGIDAVDAPDAELDDLAERDQGTTYNGWTQAASGYKCQFGNLFSLSHTLTRSSGDLTRGGGACAVGGPGAACTSDTTCTTSAQATWGPQAWGYCYSGACYTRYGSQAGWCALNPNRSPGTLSITDASYTGYGTPTHFLGCMTKTVGPNTACGGTNSSLYMRTVATGSTRSCS